MIVPPTLEDHPSIILASASPRRRELMGLLRVPFEVIPSEYEEQMPASHADVPQLAEHLAAEKARDVARKYPGRLVIGSDTIVALDGRVYGKPRDAADAVRMLTELSGRTHQVVTAVALGRGADAMRSTSVTTEVTFRALQAEEIRSYVDTDEPLDKAGAYGIQYYGVLLIAGIRGDYTNVVGFPLPTVMELLRAEGIPVLGLSGSAKP
jgi:septum formation protein